MDFKLAHKLQIPITSLTHKISVNALNGQELPNISHTTEPITLITSGNHTETLSFLLMDSPLAPLVLGSPNTTPELTGVITLYPCGVTSVLSPV